jgi:23S rRNA pseudouridine1911/1915/1917 synthase
MKQKNLEVIFENGDIVAVNKPAGLMVHGVAGKISAEPALTDMLLKRYPEMKKVGDDPGLRPGIVHRLDKDTSGVMVVARNQRSFEYLKSLFKGRDVKKTYLAVVSGIPKKKEGTIDEPIGILTGSTKRSVRSGKMLKPAVTEYKLLATRNWPPEAGKNIPVKRDGAHDASNPPPYSLLEIHPLTGRTHQIRVHLKSIGHPVVGDPLYGQKKQPSWATRLMLHAESIEFTDKEGNRLRFDAEPPAEFKKIFP